MDKMIIAIDGPAGAGKSEVAKRVAHALGYKYIDTGALYRAIAWKILKDNVNTEKEEAVEQVIKSIKITWQSNGNIFNVFLDGEDITGKIRTQAVTSKSNSIAQLKSVRDYLLRLQQRAGIGGGIVMEGRDIGTVVFPDAEKKFYIDASIRERANRRYLELKEKGQNVELNQIEELIRIRDDKDKNRSFCPLKIAADASVIDTTNLKIEQVVNIILSEIKK